MLIDHYLANFDVVERHQIIIRAPVDKVYEVVRELDISCATIARVLFRIRGMTGSSRVTKETFLKWEFSILEEKENSEIVFGLVGKFWTPKGKICRIERKAFGEFSQAGFAKAAWNFTLTEQRGDETVLKTETRVQCLDRSSRRRFRFYWFFIAKFSGLIRKEILQTLKKSAEEGSFEMSV